MRITLIICSFLVSSLFAQNNIWSLQRCVDYALQNNLTVQQSALGVDRATVNLRNARGQQLPSLNARVGGALRGGFVIDPVENTRTQSVVFSNSLDLSSDMTIYNGGRIQNSIRQSLVDEKIAELDLEAAQNDITLAVVQGYVNILLQQELVESAQYQIGTTKERLERTQKLVKAGAAAPAALLDLQSQIATEELNLVNARNQVEFAHLRLMQLLRLPLDQPFGIERPGLDAPDGTENRLKPGEVFDIAQKNQPVIRAADLRINSADYGIEIAKAGRVPNLGISAGINTVYSNIRRQFDFIPTFVTDTIYNLGIPNAPDKIPVQFRSAERVANPYPIFNQYVDNFNWFVGAGLNIPIFNGGQVVNGIQLAEITKRQAEVNADIQRQNLEQTIQQASLDVKTSFAQYEATLKQVEALETAFENAEKQLNLGVINSVDFLVAKNNLNRANNDLIRARFDFIFKSKILDFYAGREIKL